MSPHHAFGLVLQVNVERRVDAKAALQDETGAVETLSVEQLFGLPAGKQREMRRNNPIALGDRLDDDWLRGCLVGLFAGDEVERHHAVEHDDLALSSRLRIVQRV